jgi:hypothetical protein
LRQHWIAGARKKEVARQKKWLHIPQWRVLAPRRASKVARDVRIIVEPMIAKWRILNSFSTSNAKKRFHCKL